MSKLVFLVGIEERTVAVIKSEFRLDAIFSDGIKWRPWIRIFLYIKEPTEFLRQRVSNYIGVLKYEDQSVDLGCHDAAINNSAVI